MTQRLALLFLLVLFQQGAFAAVSPNSHASSVKKQCARNEMNLNLVDVPVTSVLQLLADFSGYKLAANPSIIGRGTFRYQCTSWEDVLKDIAIRHNLVIKIESLSIVVQQ